MPNSDWCHLTNPVAPFLPASALSSTLDSLSFFLRLENIGIGECRANQCQRNQKYLNFKKYILVKLNNIIYLLIILDEVNQRRQTLKHC